MSLARRVERGEGDGGIGTPGSADKADLDTLPSIQTPSSRAASPRRATRAP